MFLSGCVLRAKQQTKAGNPPPPPKPATITAPAAPPPPLSILQTQVELPAAQPISAQALESLKPLDEPAETQRPSRPPRRAGPVAAPPHPETPPAQVQPTPPPEPERPPIQEIVPAAELKHLQDSADGRKRDIRKVLDQIGTQRLNATQRDKIERIKSFLALSDEAESRNDMRQADALAEKAQILVGELQSGR